MRVNSCEPAVFLDHANHGRIVAQHIFFEQPRRQIRRRGILRSIDPPKAAGQETADGWDVETYPWNVAQVRRLAKSSAWEDVYDRAYTMALDLGAG